MELPEFIVTAVTPSLGAPGGEAVVHCRGFRPGLPSRSKALFGDVEAGLVSASEDRVVVRLPQNCSALGVCLQVDGTRTPVYPFALAATLATDLHPVANPVVAPDGAIITTISGSRGQQVSQPLVRVTRLSEKVPFNCEIMNPTGLAFDRGGQLYISSRHEGTVYRYRDFEQLEVVAEDLGIACGIAFDSEGFLYVGDRSGKIYRISASGEKREFVHLEPSVSAYHLAVDNSDRLYVTGPTISLRDCLYRVSKSGDVEVLLRGLARPQGMAFLPNGDLLIAAAYRGKKGIFKFSPDTGSLVHYIAGPMLVGVAVAEEEIFLVDNSTLYWIRPGGGSASVV